MKKLPQETIEAVSNLIRKGMSVYDACGMHGIFPIPFKANLPPEEYYKLLDERKAYRARMKAKSIEQLVERVCERVRNGETVTGAIYNEGENNHTLYTNMSKEQKHRLNLSRAEYLVNKYK